MVPGGPGEGSSSGAPNWTDETLYQQNLDWIPSTSAPHFDFQYATGHHEVQSSFQLPATSADPDAARTTGGYPLVDQGQSWNLDDEYQGTSYGWPSVAGPTTQYNASPSQSFRNPGLVQNVLNAAPIPSVRPLNIPGARSGQDLGSQPGLGGFARPRSVVSPPSARQASETPIVAAATLDRPHTIAQETPSTAPTRQAAQKRRAASKSLSPTSAQTSPTRKRRGGVRSPLSRQSVPKTPFQPNEEEEARRIHMASVSRGPSLVPDATAVSRRRDEPDSAGAEENLRVAESKMLENLGAGRTPGVLRTPQSRDESNEQFTLPPGKGFPIQIGSELFRLSGASIMSDCQ